MCFWCCWYFNMCVHTGLLNSGPHCCPVLVDFSHYYLFGTVKYYIVEPRENQQLIVIHLPFISQFCCLEVELKRCSCRLALFAEHCKCNSATLQVEFVFYILLIVVNKQTDINLSPFLLCSTSMCRHCSDNDGYLTLPWVPKVKQ